MKKISKIVLNFSKNYQRINPDPSRQPQTYSGNSRKNGKKSQKKSNKNRRADPKKVVTALLKNVSKDVSCDSMQASTSTALPGNESGIKTSNKVKSASWKRSEKSSAFTSKKTSKALSKRSPNWLKFSNVQGKIAEKVIQKVNANSAACRPGTLYSDVLFRAGTSSLVKVKTLTPRRDAAQKKLTRALFKYSSEKNGDLESEEDEVDVEAEHDIFPSLCKFPAIKIDDISAATRALHPMESAGNGEYLEPIKPCCNTTSDRFGSFSGNTMSTSALPQASSNSVSCTNGAATSCSSSPANNNLESYENADVVILSECYDNCPSIMQASYGHYLEQQFQGTATNTNSCSYPPSYPLWSKFSINIPEWNFTETKSDEFPKFLGQFEDENYLNMEKLAMLTLNLALGNNAG